ncbi:uncharacterized protein [Littorina saxatilis]|uniref:uncharacterized protein n=1 Tax=Littorina saxatilis TaxID=31220 RepID=UPI0038B5FEAE
MHAVLHMRTSLSSHKRRKSVYVWSGDVFTVPHNPLKDLLGVSSVFRRREKHGRRFDSSIGGGQLVTSGSTESNVPMSAPANTEACLRAGWIYHQKSSFGKIWQKRWLTIGADGAMTVSKGRNSKPRKSHTYDLRHDCMYIWTASQCQHLLPPSDVSSGNLIELLLTGDRRLAFCGLTPEESELWQRCIVAAQSEKQLPPTRNGQTSRSLPDVPEQETAGCCICSRPSSKVTAFDYRYKGQCRDKNPPRNTAQPVLGAIRRESHGARTSSS